MDVRPHTSATDRAWNPFLATCQVTVCRWSDVRKANKLMKQMGQKDAPLAISSLNDLFCQSLVEGRKEHGLPLTITIRNLLISIKNGELRLP
jgi:hypothetical protein